MAGRACLGIMMSLLFVPVHAATAIDSPHAFLQRLYAAYSRDGKGNDFAYPEARAIVDASLLALLRRDRILSKGEVGALDFDPICQCQDWGAFKIVSLHAQMDGRDRAQGDVTFKNDSGDTGNAVHFDLVFETGMWKIHDLSWHGTPSLRSYLRGYKY